jgi:hypothetical protein
MPEPSSNFFGEHNEILFSNNFDSIFSISLLLITTLFDEDDPEAQENRAFEQIEIRDIPVLTPEMGSKLALLPMSCIKKEYPNKPGHVHESASSEVSHTIKTPIFSGCFDWHSAVHMHWTLIRLIRLFPDLKQKDQIISLMNEQFTEEKVGTELAFLNSKYNETFERTYGWAWLLRLQSEFILLNDENGRKWAQTLAPLVKVIRDRSRSNILTNFPNLSGPELMQTPLSLWITCLNMPKSQMTENLKN